MNTKHFDSILELAKTRNFNRAAENLYISQPTLTYQINTIEHEIGFRLFDRSGKGASLTPAGEQFVTSIREISAQLNRAIEQGQNFSTKYRDNIRIVMPVRSSIYYLPDIINLFHQQDASVSITPMFAYYDYLDPFLKGETDIIFAFKERLQHIPNIRIHHLYESHIYLICRSDDVLAHKKIITKDDLSGRTLMIGGGSPERLKKLQQEIIADPSISYFNSNDHDTSLTFVAAGQAVVLSPGILNDHNPQFSWIPFDTGVSFECVLATHAQDHRKSVKEFVDLMVRYYSNKDLIL